MKKVLLIAIFLVFAANSAYAADIDFSLSFPKSQFIAAAGSNYACAESATSSKPFFGLIFAGKTLNYVDIDEDSANYKLTVSQQEDGNRLIIPSTVGGCIVVPIKLIDFNNVLSNQGAFVPVHTLTKIVLEYPGIDIAGKLSGSNRFSLILKKEISGNIRIVVEKK